MLTEAEALELAELEKEFNKPERVKIARPERGLVADLASSAARGLALGATGLLDLPRMLGSLALKQRLPRRSLTERAETFLDSTPLKRSQNMSGKVVEEIAGLAGSGGALGLAGRGALKLGAKSLGRGLKGVSNIGSNKWANVGAGTALAFEKENPNTNALRQFVVGLGGGMVGRSTVGGASSVLSKFKNNDYKKLDDLARKAVEKSHQDISQQYGSLMNPIKKGVKNKDVDLKPVYQGLVDQYQSLKSPAAKNDFLKSDLGKVYTQFKEYPQKVSFNEAEALRAMLRRKGEAAGAFEPTRSSTGGEFRKMDGKFNEQMQETVRKYAPKKLKDYQEANKLWSHKKSFLDPLREDIDKNGHLLGGRFNASVKGIGEGATHSNHVLENLYGKDRHEFAKAALKELRSGKGLELTKPGKSLRNLSENYFNVPKQHLDLMSHANKPTLMGKLGNMGLSSRLGNLSLSSIAALPKGLTPSESLELAELEREFGGRHEHRRGGHVRAEAQRLRHMGRDGDTDLVHVNEQEKRMLKAMGGRGSINPKTGLREYPRKKNTAKQSQPETFEEWKKGKNVGTVDGYTGYQQYLQSQTPYEKLKEITKKIKKDNTVYNKPPHIKQKPYKTGCGLATGFANIKYLKPQEVENYTPDMDGAIEYYKERVIPHVDKTLAAKTHHDIDNYLELYPEQKRGRTITKHGYEDVDNFLGNPQTKKSGTVFTGHAMEPEGIELKPFRNKLSPMRSPGKKNYTGDFGEREYTSPERLKSALDDKKAVSIGFTANAGGKEYNHAANLVNLQKDNRSGRWKASIDDPLNSQSKDYEYNPKKSPSAPFGKLPISGAEEVNRFY